jgi:hypothetical protein
MVISVLSRGSNTGLVMNVGASVDSGFFGIDGVFDLDAFIPTFGEYAHWYWPRQLRSGYSTRLRPVPLTYPVNSLSP